MPPTRALRELASHRQMSRLCWEHFTAESCTDVDAALVQLDFESDVYAKHVEPRLPHSPKGRTNEDEKNSIFAPNS